MRTEVEVLEAKVRLLNQAIEILTDMKDDLEKENEELKCDIEYLNDVNNNMTHENKRLEEENEQLAKWLEQETLRLEETEEYCQDLYLENKELKMDNERLTKVANNNYEFMVIYRDKYHKLLENVNNLINKYERGECDDCK